MLESYRDQKKMYPSEVPDIPAPVVVEEPPRAVDRYEDDDVELI
jgi:hypothetical protein